MENGFEKYKISEEIKKSIDAMGYKNPSDVQKRVIPEALEKKKKIPVYDANGLLSEEMRLVSKKSGEYKPVTVYTDPLTGKRIAPDVGWSYNPASGLNDD